jgi:glycosyltransferase involved in cell wall biosynthesis
MTNKKLSIVVPVFNEEKNIKEFTERLLSSLKSINLDYEIIFVLDPSNDSTEDKILEEINLNKKIKLICMSRRFGQPQATIAGIQNISGDRCVIIDCDLQDPPELIPEMNKKFDQGYDVVVAKRNKRAGETFTKRLITKIGYYFINKITEIKIPINSGDYRIISDKVIRELRKFNDKSAFLRGLTSYIGFKQTYILYNREKRNKGHGKYNRYFGSLKIAINGIVGFSSRPILFITLLGLIVITTSIITFLTLIILSIFITNIISLNLFIYLSIILLFGINFLSIGILGEYIGRIYDEVNKRPSYIIEKKINFN